ncbi:MAG: ABC transporter permease [Bacteroidetes bacterium]|nr:ABC transporter permease [Bacteroidota bacterium]NOG95104.1 ABC transporter permease [Bacteroidota bacterium]GIK68981.1 MAG: ABC transporter permease [Bacteroidota bacterium]
MGKIGIIIQREYFSRVKKKSFIIMTVLGPVLMAAIMIVPLWIAMQDKTVQRIQVIDDSGLFQNLLQSDEYNQFDFTPINIFTAKENFYSTDYNVILYIPPSIIKGNYNVQLFYKKQPGVSTEMFIRSQLEERITDMKLFANKIDVELIKKTKTKINLSTNKIEEDGKSTQTSTAVNMFIGFVGAILIYIFIFLYGVQVMRGVIEEKTNRIVEVIISSVRPFQLMMGKIVGIALVGLTQFLLWTILTFTIYTVTYTVFLGKIDNNIEQIEKIKQSQLEKGPFNAPEEIKKMDSSEVIQIMRGLKQIDFVALFLCFVFYFIAGYLLYGALFAAIGSSVDNEADTQQFMLPVTVPLILSFVVAQSIMQNPEGSLSFWFSVIPFTSPVVMMVRLPLGVPVWQLATSMILLAAGFIATTWLAGKIYRTGILMYGKKITYSEIFKWLRFNS